MSLRCLPPAGIIVLVLLLFPSAAALSMGSPAPSLLIGVNIAQEKNLYTATVEDKVRIADQAMQQGDYQRAAEVYDLAEAQWERDHQRSGDRNWYYYDYVAMMERRKVMAYEKWGGHEAHIAIAEDRIKAAQTRSSEAAAHERSASGCLIVTAAYGSPMSSEVQLVREYRDGTIRQSYAGSQFFVGFNAWYYSFSPAVSGYIATHPVAKSVMQVSLVPLLWIVLFSGYLHAALVFSPELATVSVLLFGSCCYSLVYIIPPVLLLAWVAVRNGRRFPGPGCMKPVLLIWVLLLGCLAAGIALSMDFLTVITSGLLVACTVLLTAGAGTLAILRFRPETPVVR